MRLRDRLIEVREDIRLVTAENGVRDVRGREAAAHSRELIPLTKSRWFAELRHNALG
jgi:hypothetical protein